MKTSLTAAILCAPLLTAPASADIIYDNGVPDLQNAFFSDDGGAGAAIVAEDFVLEQGGETISDIHMVGHVLFQRVGGRCIQDSHLRG